MTPRRLIVPAAVLLASLFTGCTRAARGSADPNLQQVWALYLEPVRASQESEFATARMRELINGGGRFILVDTPEQAHAVVRVIVGFERPHASEVDPPQLGELTRRTSQPTAAAPTGSIVLLDPDVPGRVIWTRGYTPSSSRHRRRVQPAQMIVNGVIGSLAGDLRRAAGRRMQ